MDVISYSAARQNLKSVMDKVIDDCSEVIITRRNGQPVVMVSLDDWNSIMETEYLLSTPANAERLRRGIKQFESGKGKQRELIGP